MSLVPPAKNLMYLFIVLQTVLFFNVFVGHKQKKAGLCQPFADGSPIIINMTIGAF